MAQVAEGGAVWKGLYYNLTQGRVLMYLLNNIITCTVGHSGVKGNKGGAVMEGLLYNLAKVWRRLGT